MNCNFSLAKNTVPLQEKETVFLKSRMKMWMVKSDIDSDGINPFPNNPLFLRVYTVHSFENNVGKGEIACNEQFLLFSQCFLPF